MDIYKCPFLKISKYFWKNITSFIFTTISFHFTKITIYLSQFLQIFTRFYKSFSFFMIPKRQNHTLSNLIAAAPMRTYGRCFAVFCVVTEYAIKSANLHFDRVTIKMDRKWVNERWSLSRFGNIIYIVLQYMLFICYL